jgi:hypothetical protein
MFIDSEKPYIFNMLILFRFSALFLVSFGKLCKNLTLAGTSWAQSDPQEGWGGSAPGIFDTEA